MYAQVNRSIENKSRAVAKTVTQNKSNVSQSFGFVDNRPVSIAQRKMQALIRNSFPQITQKKQGRVKPTMRMKGGVNVNNDRGLEKEMDVIGAKVTHMRVAENSEKMTQLYKVQKGLNDSCFNDLGVIQGTWINSEPDVWRDTTLGLIYHVGNDLFIDVRTMHSEWMNGDFDSVCPGFTRNRAQYVQDIETQMRLSRDGGGSSARSEDVSEDVSEEAFDGMVMSLPESVIIAGIAMSWTSAGSNNILKPDGRDYPHLTVMGNTNLNKLHFTSAQYNSETGNVSVIRKGYRWNGMISKLVDDPEFDIAEQTLAITSISSTHATFTLSGGRAGQTVAIGFAHVAMPSSADLASALNISS